MRTKKIRKYWRTRCVQANRRRSGKFTAQDMHDANSWTRCAVGEFASRFPGVRSVSGDYSDRDGDLDVYGMRFYHAVIENDVLGAFEHLDIIEARVAELLEEANA